MRAGMRLKRGRNRTTSTARPLAGPFAFGRPGRIPPGMRVVLGIEDDSHVWFAGPLDPPAGPDRGVQSIRAQPPRAAF